MKKTIILSSLFILVYSSVFAQDPEFEYYKSREIKTLLGRDRAGGGYGAFTSGYSVIDNRHAVLFGGRFGWLANHSIGIGIGATGFINEFHYEPSLDRDVFLAGGYGGLYIEPILMPRFPIHLSFPVLFGAGGISYVSKESSLNNNLIEDSEAFLLIEPAAEIELNLTRFFRLAIGASYRFPTSFDVGLSGTPTANAQSIKGMSYTATFKFGKF
ncbi:MAG: hypothetical protein EPN88_01215 [Bacteroidetes bacterium]|nr:MAG: hypothetical protein EPN88_01215 [Bacteroidota bacterium]